MLEKNIFNIALSCSLVWHLLGGQAVKIVGPARLTAQQFTSINFWGCILESVDYNFPDENIEGEIEAPKETENEVYEKHTADKFSDVQKKSIPLAKLSTKASPKVTIEMPDSDKFLISEEFISELKRSLLLKPKLPEYPAWAKKIGSDFEIELKFLILPDGTIGKVEKITSSGYPELDEIGVRYMRKWKFISLPADKPQIEQWANIKLNFKLQ